MFEHFEVYGLVDISEDNVKKVQEIFIADFNTHTEAELFIYKEQKTYDHCVIKKVYSK